MSKETIFPHTEFESQAVGLAKTFIQRWDLYPRQIEDGSYLCIHKPLLPSHVQAHMEGKLTLGAYVLDPISRARYIVLDADTPEQLEGLILMSADLTSQQVPSYLESSRRGAHLWLFFSQPITGKDARLFGQNLIRFYSLVGIELFPKQDRLKDGPGSLIRLPFGIHQKTHQRYNFVTPDFKPLTTSFTEQVRRLCAPETVPESFLAANLVAHPSEPQKAVSGRLESLKHPLSERIKASVSVYEFINQYVELSPAGRGNCPFHDDQHASFAVNPEGNYWHCFAGCGGGSIIDFWMKYKSCDFSSAVRELAQMLL